MNSFFWRFPSTKKKIEIQTETVNTEKLLKSFFYEKAALKDVGEIATDRQF